MSIMEKLKGIFKKKPKQECTDECCKKGAAEPAVEQKPVEAPVEEAPKAKASNTAPWQQLDRKISGKK